MAETNKGINKLIFLLIPVAAILAWTFLSKKSEDSTQIKENPTEVPTTIASNQEEVTATIPTNSSKSKITTNSSRGGNRGRSNGRGSSNRGRESNIPNSYEDTLPAPQLFPDKPIRPTSKYLKCIEQSLVFFTEEHQKNFSNQHITKDEIEVALKQLLESDNEMYNFLDSLCAKKTKIVPKAIYWEFKLQIKRKDGEKSVSFKRRKKKGK